MRYLNARGKVVVVKRIRGCQEGWVGSGGDGGQVARET